MKKALAMFLSVLLFTVAFAGCTGNSGAPATDSSAGSSTDANPATQESSVAKERKEITLWFWGTSDYQRTAMETYLIDGFNASQDEYTLRVEYRASVDNDITVALSGGSGPDIVYGSGPAFVAGYAAEGLLANMDEYAAKYGWRDRLVGAFYDIGTVNDSLYSLPCGLSGIGIFYNQALFDENGWTVPTTYDEVTAIMDKAIDAGLHGGIIGARDWRYTNDWPLSLSLASVAGPEAVYKALSGEQKWNSPEIAAAIEENVNWYNKGYFGGEDYWNLDANEASQMLLSGGTPFFFAPLNGFQWLKNVATSDEQLANIRYMPMPSKADNTPAVMLGSVCTLSINAQSKNQAGAAAVLDYMMTTDFSSKMSRDWPGYWGLPLKGLAEIDTSSFEGLSAQYIDAVSTVINALNSGRFGFMAGSAFPAVTYETSIDIDTVWLGDKTVDEYLNSLDAAYAEDVAAGSVIPVPKPEY